MFMIRFTAHRTGADPAYTYLRHLASSNRYTVGHGGVTAKPHAVEQANKWATREEAYAALGAFIIQKGGLKDSDWISDPELVEYKPEPVLLATASVGGAEVTLHKEDDTYVVRTPSGTAPYQHRGQAIDAYVAAVASYL